MDPLASSLLDLVYELRDAAVPLTVGGGYGLYLKRRHIEQLGLRTLLDRLPETRSTNDLDLFLRAEVLADVGRTEQLAAAIARLGYEPVPEARYLQWRRQVEIGPVMQEVKIDLLVGPLGQYREALRVKSPRARPKGDVKLHAHCVEEAIGLERRPIGIRLEGCRIGGEAYSGEVFVPQAFPYLMMKLCAFRDRKDDPRKDAGRHHALDLYNIVGMMTEEEYEAALDLGRRHREDPRIADVRGVVGEHFSDPTALGILRLREHPLWRPEFQLDEFVAVLSEVFEI
ncbi:hypothetical protein [Tautonia sociabilis]|uniref:Nucleotidyl transferase AbiEii/AbiGii toxin family protein n=1 Tax=Tautonia sociabilis TaxID=2080755 RepID=A0A432MCM2_9BACT|nr:hypothetical protein [Tautonia sociabilis]RUL81900.1 hypothetical protein TsocGM_24335 [Tautonia sociabilis]